MIKCSAACRTRQQKLQKGQGNFRGDGSALYFDRGGGYTTVSICQNFTDYTLERMNFARKIIHISMI